jgi:hypothetical protein
MLLTTQFDILASHSKALATDEEEAVALAKEMIDLEGAGESQVPGGQPRNRLLQTRFAAIG